MAQAMQRRPKAVFSCTSHWVAEGKGREVNLQALFNCPKT